MYCTERERESACLEWPPGKSPANLSEFFPPFLNRPERCGPLNRVDSGAVLVTGQGILVDDLLYLHYS